MFCKDIVGEIVKYCSLEDQVALVCKDWYTAYRRVTKLHILIKYGETGDEYLYDPPLEMLGVDLRAPWLYMNIVKAKRTRYIFNTDLSRMKRELYYRDTLQTLRIEGIELNQFELVDLLRIKTLQYVTLVGVKIFDVERRARERFKPTFKHLTVKAKKDYDIFRVCDLSEVDTVELVSNQPAILSVLLTSQRRFKTIYLVKALRICSINDLFLETETALIDTLRIRSLHLYHCESGKTTVKIGHLIIDRLDFTQDADVFIEDLSKMFIMRYTFGKVNKGLTVVIDQWFSEKVYGVEEWF